MRIALEAATLSTCSRLRVGAVLAQGNHVQSTGYNGAPKGVQHCKHVDDTPCRVAVHAEVNALLFSTVVTHRDVLYVTHAPCFECAKLIINAGVKSVVYLEKYRSTEGLDLLQSARVDFKQITLQTKDA